MRDLRALALAWEGGRLRILDQTRLPGVEAWCEADAPEVMADHIRKLRVRGAPLIGVAAALSAAALAVQGAGEAELRSALAVLRSARPTAVNLMAAMDRLTGILDAGGSREAFVEAAEGIFLEDVALCEHLAAAGAALVQPGESVLTHCNAGALATAGLGTALGVIRRAFERGHLRHVYVDETRPLLQGARLTAWELGRAGIPHTLITDSMAGAMMAQGLVQRVFVGADRIAANGDFANKIGTYGVAVLARHLGIPFHPVAPWTTVDLACPDGASIPIEERDGDEVRGYGALQWAPAGCPVANPSFDVTPAELVTSLVLDRGILEGPELRAGKLAEVGGCPLPAFTPAGPAGRGGGNRGIPGA